MWIMVGMAIGAPVGLLIGAVLTAANIADAAVERAWWHDAVG